MNTYKGVQEIRGSQFGFQNGLNAREVIFYMQTLVVNWLDKRKSYCFIWERYRTSRTTNKISSRVGTENGNDKEFLPIRVRARQYVFKTIAK